MAHEVVSKTLDNTSGLSGLVVCGGSSSRMGKDKSKLVYYDKPQFARMFEMLEGFCGKVYLSCNPQQVETMPEAYEILVDLPQYHNAGPMAALLTAFTHFPKNRFLIIGCDYPFVTVTDIREFLSASRNSSVAASFYNPQHEVYEPLLALYNPGAAAFMFEMHAKGEYSLQHFLRANDAVKFYPENKKSIFSVDTREQYIDAVTFINHQIAKQEISKVRHA